MNKPLVSIIVPVYNAERSLEKCIKSLVNQTYKNIEILLIDDGSTDNSWNIISNFKKKYSCIQAYKKKNRGVSITRNFGLKMSKGEYLLFCDSDDWNDLNRVDNLMKEMNENDADIVIAGYTIVNPEQSTKVCYENEDNLNNIPDALVYLEKKKLINSPWTSLYKKSIIQKHDIKFKEGLSYGEDLLFNLTYLKYINSLRILPETLYYYVQSNNESLTSKYIENRMETKNANLKMRAELYNIFNMHDDKYRIAYANFYVESLYNSIMNLYHLNCPYPIRKKIKILSSLLSDKYTQEQMGINDNNSKHIQLFKKIYKMKSGVLFYILFALINKLLKVKVSMKNLKYKKREQLIIEE